MDGLLRTREAARLLGLSASFLNQRRVKGGGPPYAKVGRIVVYDPADLRDWAKKHLRRSTSGPSG
jgi:predicted DNA-binding transcriptional regulator AlpA